MRNIDIIFCTILVSGVILYGISMSPYNVMASETDVENVTSTATINKQIAIGLGANLASGIEFGTVNPASNNNADPENGADNAVTADASNNIGIDLCIRANANLSQSASVAIPMVNYTWWDNTTATVTNNETTMSTTYQKAFHSNVVAGNTLYYGFWVDIPPAKTAGAYNNTIQFKAVETGAECGT